MRRIGEILKDFGFKEGSNADVQQAFVKHLIRVAKDTSVQNPSPIPEQSQTLSEEPKQLSFDPEILGPASALPRRRSRGTR